MTTCSSTFYHYSLLDLSESLSQPVSSRRSFRRDACSSPVRHNIAARNMLCHKLALLHCSTSGSQYCQASIQIELGEVILTAHIHTRRLAICLRSSVRSRSKIDNFLKAPIITGSTGGNFTSLNKLDSSTNLYTWY